MFNLINILGQNTLPEQVEVNKQNIAILADEVEKLGYQPKGVYDAETEYNHNDVVFYDNKLYVVTSDAAIVGVLPTNTTYWQQVTGDIRGQQGAQGAQGEAGAAGAAGLNALEFAQLLTVSTIGDVGTLSLQVSEANFNRQTIQYEHFNCYAKDSNNKVYLFDAQVTIAGQHGVPASQAQISLNLATKFLISGENGADGATGQAALVYGRKINFIWNEQDEQLISGLSLSFQDFNRVPELNEDFVAILHDTMSAVDYLAMGEIQTKSNLNVTSIVATDINRITGQNGQNGTNGTNGTDGTDGKDAIMFKLVHQTVVEPTVGFNFNDLRNYNFTSIPQVGDYASVIMKNISNNHTYYCIGQITNISASGNCTFNITAVSDITGEAGASPAKLYLHYIAYDHTSTTQCRAKFCFSCINNNPNWDDTDNNAGKLIHYLTETGLNSVDKMLPLSGYIETTIGGNVYKSLIGIYSNLAGYRTFVYDNGDGTYGEVVTNMGGSITKVTVELQ